jgi:hypothetical protein
MAYSNMQRSRFSSQNEALGSLFSLFQDTGYIYFQDFRLALQARAHHTEELSVLLDEWITRLNGNSFLGDAVPNLADFYMYANLYCYRDVLAKPMREKVELESWFLRMAEITDQTKTDSTLR